MSPTGDTLEHTRMSLGEHLEELRRRLVRCILVLLVVFVAAWVLRDELARYATWPWRQAVGRINADLLERAEARLVAEPGLARSELFLSDDPADKHLRGALEERLLAIGVGEGFFLALWVSLYFAAIVAGPYVLWELWGFIAAGLYRHEKRMVGLYFPFSLLLFATGVAFCYFLIVPSGLYFLATTLPVELVRTELSAEKYFSFLSAMCLAMGAIFQLPILMVFFASIGLVDPKSYARWRKHFIVVALFVAAIVTPSPDAITQLLTAAPMLVLYEVGIWLARWRARPRQAPGGGAA